MKIQNAHSGFSLVEILVAVAILIFIGTLGLSELSSLRDSLQTEKSAEDIRTLLLEAHAKTLAGEDALRHGVHFASDKAVLFSGDTYIAPGNKELLLPTAVRIQNIALSGGGADVLFKKLTGETDQDGSLVVYGTGQNPHTRTIFIEKTGVVRIQ